MLQDISPLKINIQYLPESEPDENSIIFCFKGCDVIASDDSGKPFPTVRQLGGSDITTYLFSIGNTKYFLGSQPVTNIPENFGYVNIKSLRRAKDAQKINIFALFTAYHLSVWYAKNRFCGECGGKTVRCTTERALLCTGCGELVYPRINPAVIAGITDGSRLLVTRYVPSRGVNNVALVAGYMEIGETPEDTVRREITEEVGLKVKNIRYYKSQPWGYSSGLLIGYFCEVDGGTEITLDKSELSCAEWIERKDISGQSDDFSLTNEMMIYFKEHPELF